MNWGQVIGEVCCSGGALACTARAFRARHTDTRKATGDPTPLARLREDFLADRITTVDYLLKMDELFEARKQEIANWESFDPFTDPLVSQKKAPPAPGAPRTPYKPPQVIHALDQPYSVEIVAPLTGGGGGGSGAFNNMVIRDCTFSGRSMQARCPCPQCNMAKCPCPQCNTVLSYR